MHSVSRRKSVVIREAVSLSSRLEAAVVGKRGRSGAPLVSRIPMKGDNLPNEVFDGRTRLSSTIRCQDKVYDSDVS